MRKHLALCPFPLRLEMTNGHVTGGALVLNRRLGLGVIHAFAPDAALPIGVAGRISHHAGTPIETDGDVFTGRRDESIVTSQAAVRGPKTRGGRALPFARSSVTAQQAWRPRQQSQHDKQIPKPFAHHQPSFSLPSAQSHSI